MDEFHRLQVEQHCRVCAGRLTRVTYQCSKHKENLGKHLRLNVVCDQEGVHPQVFCNTCWAKLRKLDKAVSSGSDPYQPHPNPLSLDRAYRHMQNMRTLPAQESWRQASKEEECLQLSVVGGRTHPLDCRTTPPILHCPPAISFL